MLHEQAGRKVTRRSVMGAAWQIPVAAALLSQGFAVSTALAQDGKTTLNWSLEGVSDLVSLDPATASDAQGFTAVGLLYGGLVRLTADLLVEPDLAESWTVSEDGLTYTFTLRDGAMFSDGTPITSADVVASLNHALDPSTGAWTGPYYLSLIQGANEMASSGAEGPDGTPMPVVTELSGVKAIDDRTVEITITAPSAYFLSVLSLAPAKIAPAGAVGAGDGKVTSGPFTLEAWNRGQGLVLVPNANYWEPADRISKLNLIFNQDSETAYQLYRTGKLDIMGSQQNPVPAARVAEVKDSPEFKSASAFNNRYIAFNNKLKPFDDVRVRQALAHSIDRDTLANVVLGGTVNPTGRILPAGFPGSELPIEELAFDPAAAKQLLTDAGIDPASFSFKLTYGVEGDNEKVVTVLQSMWQENLGIKVELEPLELSTFSSRLNDMVQDPEKGLQAFYSVWGADYPDPQNWLSLLLHTGAGNNNPMYSNAEFDTLTEEADVMTGDFAPRAELYNKAEQLAVTEVAWLPLFNGLVNVLVKDCVKGVVVTGNGIGIPNYSDLAGCS